MKKTRNEKGQFIHVMSRTFKDNVILFGYVATVVMIYLGMRG